MSIVLNNPNLATRDAVRRFVEDEITGEILRVRLEKQPLHRQTEAYDRIARGTLDKQSYQGRHKAYLTAGRKMKESFRHGLRQGAFPNSEWFTTDLVENVTDEARRQAQHSLQLHHLNQSMRVPFHFDPFADQLLVRGTSGVKHAWEHQMRKVRELVRRQDKRTKKGTRLETVVREVAFKYGPTWRTMDFYSTYVDPVTVDDHTEATLKFEDKMVTEVHLKDMATRYLDPEEPSLGHVYEHMEEALAGVPDPRFKEERKARLTKRGLTDPLNSYPKDDLHQLTEAWWFGEIPGASHLDDETGEEVETGATMWLLTLIDTTFAVRIQQNPFWFGTTPHHIPRLFRQEGEFWGHSIFEGADRIQYLMNDVMNHTLDLFSLTANPIAMIDPSAHPRANTLRVLPLARWLVRPDAVRFDRPPDATPSGISMVNQLQAMFDDYSEGNAPAQGRAAARGRGRVGNTATGMGFMIQNQSQVVSNILDNLGEELFVPILDLNVKYQQQFMTDEMMLRIGGVGTAPLVERPIGIEDVMGKYAFRWLVGTAHRERVSLASQMERLIPLLVQIKSTPGIAPGLEIDFGYIVRRIWQDGLGLHGAERAVRTPDQLPSIAPEIEHDLLEQDRPIEVRPGDDHMAHLESHLTRGVQRFEADPDRAQRLLAHIARHSQAMEQQLLQQEQAAQQQQQAQAGPPQGGPPTPQNARQQSMPQGGNEQPNADIGRSIQ